MFWGRSHRVEPTGLRESVSWKEALGLKLRASPEAPPSRHASVRHGLAECGLRDAQGRFSSSGLKHSILAWWVAMTVLVADKQN